MTKKGQGAVQMWENGEENKRVYLKNSVQHAITILSNKEVVQTYKKISDGDDEFQQLTDGYHTFEELYDHRMILSSIIFNTYPEYAWKSKLHSDGTMYDDYFIVGASIPDVGDYSYHYDLKNWDMFDVPELEHAPEYDGHKPSDITRLLALVNKD